MDAVGSSRGIGESAVEITLLEVEHTLLTVGDVLSEEVVEVVELQSKEDTATIGETGGKNQVQEESAETTTLSRCDWWCGWDSLRFCRRFKSDYDIGGVCCCLAVPCSAGLGMPSRGIEDSEEGVAGVGGFASAKNRCRRING